MLKFISILLLLFLIPIVFVTIPAYASNVSIPSGTSVPGCEEGDWCYMPSQIQITVGDTVTWTNDDTAAHTVTSGTAVNGPDGIFDSSLFMAGNSFSVTFDEAGEYPYFCMVHPWMEATVLVSESSSTTTSSSSGTGLTPRGTPLPTGQSQQSFTSDTYFNEELGVTFEVPNGWYIFDEPMIDENWKRIVTFTPDPNYLSTFFQINYVENDHDYDGLSQFQIENELSNIVKNWCSNLTYSVDNVICYNYSKTENYSGDGFYGVGASYTLQHRDGTTFDQLALYGITPVAPGEYIEIDSEVSVADAELYADDILSIVTNTTFSSTGMLGTSETIETPKTIPSTAISFSTYNSKNYDFSIDYPTGWLVDEEIIEDVNYLNMVGFTPDSNSYDYVYYDVSIQFNDLEYRGLSSSEYLEKLKTYESETCANSSINVDGYSCSNFSTSDALTGSFVDASGNTWHALYYTYTENYPDASYDIAAARFELPVKDDTWILLFYFDLGSYENYLGNTDAQQLVSDIASSFNLKSSVGTTPTPAPTPAPPSNVDSNETSGGGCLIATAAFGSELAPQVQFLREVRDNTVLSTGSGIAFMSTFNQLYYSFSPTIADWERESPVFKEAVKLFITPMISTLSIMTLAQDGSESDVLTAGISVIALNLAMYIAAPVIVVHSIRKLVKL